MKIGFPVTDNHGLESKVYAHFGSAPRFIIVDTETRELSILENDKQNHSHGACQPLLTLGGQKVEAMIVGGIGAGALKKLASEGLMIYKAQGLTIADNITCLALDELPTLSYNQTCKGHDHGNTAGHSCHHS